MAIIKPVLRWPYKNFKMLFLKVSRRKTDFRIFLSIMFHSITVDGKKDFFEKSYLTLKEGTFSTYLIK